MCEDVVMHPSRWRSLAEDGHVTAQVQLGLLLYAGDGVRRDFPRRQSGFARLRYKRTHVHSITLP